MNIIELYAVLVMGLLGFWPCIIILFRTLRLSQILMTSFERWIQYPLAIKGAFRITRLELLLIFGFIGCNIFVLAFRVSSAADFEKRSAVVSAINIIPLFLGGNPNPLFDLIGVSTGSYHLIHYWIGGVAILEGLVHAGMSIQSGGNELKISGILIFHFWCIYPSEETNEAPFQIDKYWQCHYSKKGQDERFFRGAISQATRSPGKHIVMTCGDSSFTGTARKVVIELSRLDNPIRFVELDYRPEHRKGRDSELRLQEQGDARQKTIKKTDEMNKRSA
ncbi:uncharacterized protein PpBr36_05781 [Pyricularia pennisetigena]|uniref:uncharacterized protein n=1 Tax=Pyricularia pennisetigena TaxID=1578925 RepID=UPI00114EA1BF|nr:uncharacterized protein PpBr36_05781 [Pyricularia pennisetigena]TLS23172.1 hypothetical protein PpBr36_05781 [Pyricularia pennisetigena]